MGRILVAGAGGFIGGHLVSSLLAMGADVRAVDVKSPKEWFQKFNHVENLQLDLQKLEDCRQAVEGVSEVYNLAADMGGMGFIENNKALCMLSVLINTHLLEASREFGIEKYFFASSACVYSQLKQSSPGISGLKEADAYPALPEDGYGWEKLFSERMCHHFAEDFGLSVRVARFHNVYGPQGTFDGGREKAPAAICRKVAQASLSGGTSIEIWGDGNQTRSFTFIDDCIEGVNRLMQSEYSLPINLGSSEKVSVNQLVDIVEEIAGITLERTYLLDAPKGVNGRNSDNTLIRQTLGWEPSISLVEGMEKTYRWIYDALSSGTLRR